MPRYVVERDFPSGLNIPVNEDAGGGMAQEPSLYDRLGGKPAVTAVVDDFVGNVAADKRVNGRFGNANIPRLKQLLVELICAGTGGPCTYSGRDMRTAHKGMNIGDAEFTAVVEDLVKTLDKFKVPAKEKQDLLAVLGPMKPAIVGQRSISSASMEGFPAR